MDSLNDSYFFKRVDVTISCDNFLFFQQERSHFEIRNLGLFLKFKSAKCPESWKEKNRKSGIRTFENARTTGTGRDVRLSPIKNNG